MERPSVRHRVDGIARHNRDRGALPLNAGLVRCEPLVPALDYANIDERNSERAAVDFSLPPAQHESRATSGARDCQQLDAVAAPGVGRADLTRLKGPASLVEASIPAPLVALRCGGSGAKARRAGIGRRWTL